MKTGMYDTIIESMQNVTCFRTASILQGLSTDEQLNYG